MQIFGCLLFLVFIPVLFFLFLGLSVMRRMFGGKMRSDGNVHADNGSAGSDKPARETLYAGEEKEKVIESDEGEYVDFEEVNDKK